MARKFSYNGMELPDPDPELPVDKVKQYYTATFAELNNAAVTGPEKVGDDEVYKFSKAVGAKGDQRAARASGTTQRGGSSTGRV